MKESKRVALREKAESWGCKVVDEFDFNEHMKKHSNYKLLAWYFAGMSLLLLISVVLLEAGVV